MKQDAHFLYRGRNHGLDTLSPLRLPLRARRPTTTRATALRTNTRLPQSTSPGRLVDRRREPFLVSQTLARKPSSSSSSTPRHSRNSQHSIRRRSPLHFRRQPATHTKATSFRSTSSISIQRASFFTFVDGTPIRCTLADSVCKKAGDNRGGGEIEGSRRGQEGPKVSPDHKWEAVVNNYNVADAT